MISTDLHSCILVCRRKLNQKNDAYMTKKSNWSEVVRMRFKIFPPMYNYGMDQIVLLMRGRDLLIFNLKISESWKVEAIRWQKMERECIRKKFIILTQG